MNHNMKNVNAESVIKSVYSGECSLSEVILPQSKEYRAACVESQIKEKVIKDMLSPEQKVLFDEYIEARNFENVFFVEETFKQGVIFGTKYMLEVLGE